MESDLTIGTDRTAGESGECCEANRDFSQGKLRFVLGPEAENSIYSDYSPGSWVCSADSVPVPLSSPGSSTSSSSPP